MQALRNKIELLFFPCTETLHNVAEEQKKVCMEAKELIKKVCDDEKLY